MTDTHLAELIHRGRLREALDLATAKLTEARRDDDAAALADALVDEARAQLASGARDDAVITVDEAITQARRTFGPRDPRYAAALELGGEVAVEADLPSNAEARFIAAVDVLREAGVTGYPLGNALSHHGLVREAQDDLESAARAFAAALDAVRDDPEPAAQALHATVLTALAQSALDTGRDVEARAMADRALEIWVALRQARRFEVADAMAIVGAVALMHGEAQTAVDWLEPACEIYRGSRVDVRARHALAAAHYADALRALGRVDDARAAYTRAIELLREGDPARLELEEALLDLAREAPREPTPAPANAR
jgi:tetratricopeptide (TPR) repeat protein